MPQKRYSYLTNNNDKTKKKRIQLENKTNYIENNKLHVDSF